MMNRNTLQEHLEKIYAEYGELTPQLVIDEARDDSHPLHARYEWNDLVAGEAYRRSQARDDIRSINIVVREGDVNDPEKGLRQWVSVPSEHGGRSYMPLPEVAQNDFLRRLVLQQMRAEWEMLHRKWRDHEEWLAVVTGSIEEAI